MTLPQLRDRIRQVGVRETARRASLNTSTVVRFLAGGEIQHKTYVALVVAVSGESGIHPEVV